MRKTVLPSLLSIKAQLEPTVRLQTSLSIHSRLSASQYKSLLGA
ncbi:predicted protein [Plenodomus lingam JN3]|uniref:Predicted protein n=1 Tax=Leptosphaeria maculans (strain JN3 / isolate v23.1.3 / race Av1-4-5-6-7-8) TaxID=985895 RepID=E5ADB9_LEPMJ|nr:predicted protein [Plenodomus lingam JN3]CBY02471.1 predicted protein [Plenodomus lingam JN3]